MKWSIYLLACCVLMLSAFDANSESNINDRALSINFPRVTFLYGLPISTKPSRNRSMTRSFCQC
jgi:hypothetical protein